jgi:hypothetical protein
MNQWMSNGCSAEDTYTQNIHKSSILVHIYQRKKIGLEIAAKKASAKLCKSAFTQPNFNKKSGKYQNDFLLLLPF